MVLILIMLFIATANVVGCVLIKKRGIRPAFIKSEI